MLDVTLFTIGQKFDRWGNMTSKRPVVLPSSAPCTTGEEETVHCNDTREKKIATTTARRVPLEFSASQEIWYGLTRPRRLPRIPRPPRPNIRKMAAAAVSLVPRRVKTSQAAQLARLHPGLAAWLLIFVGATASIAGLQFVEPHFRWEPERYQKWLARRGSRAVKATLAEIGPSVEIPAVRAEPIPDLYAAWYAYSDSAVTFNSQYEYLEYELINIAAHESVHAIIHQNGLHPYSTTHNDFFAMVDETAASVLGAHITGESWSRRGPDASIVTEVFFRSFRNHCDPAVSDSAYNLYLAPGRAVSGDFDRDTWHSALIHYGPLQLVDAVYEICHLHSDPTDAARAIAKRFMRTDLAPRDRPIFDEFERRRQRWSGER